MMRINLNKAVLGAMVYVVSKSELSAAVQVWSLDYVVWMIPILSERQHAANLHGKYQSIFTTLSSAASANYPIPNISGPPDTWLASGERTNTKKRIRSEAIIPGNNV